MTTFIWTHKPIQTQSYKPRFMLKWQGTPPFVEAISDQFLTATLMTRKLCWGCMHASIYQSSKKREKKKTKHLFFHFWIGFHVSDPIINGFDFNGLQTYFSTQAGPNPAHWLSSGPEPSPGPRSVGLDTCSTGPGRAWTAHGRGHRRETHRLFMRTRPTHSWPLQKSHIPFGKY